MDQKLFQNGGIMKNTIINKSKSGKYFWWAHSAPIDVLTRKRTGVNPKPRIADTLHMLRDSTACIYLSDLINGKYNFGGIIYNSPPDIYKKKNRISRICYLIFQTRILYYIQLALHFMMIKNTTRGGCSEANRN